MTGVPGLLQRGLPPGSGSRPAEALHAAEAADRAARTWCLSGGLLRLPHGCHSRSQRSRTSTSSRSDSHSRSQSSRTSTSTSSRSSRLVGSHGAVTAEFAVTLPAVLLLLAMLLAGAAAGATQLRLEEGARAGARALARGDDSATVQRVVRTLSGASASAVVSTEGEWLNVTVTDRVGGPLGASVPWTLTARASTRSETAAAS